LYNKYNLKKYTRFLAYILIAINVALFLIVELTGSSTDHLHMINFGAKFNPLILNGEWWRFFTPMFLHFGLTHLVMNMISLYVLGPLVERLFGRIRFLIIYFISGIYGVLASFVFTDGVSAGASGAIFGLFGALLFFGLIQKRFNVRIDLKQIIVLVLFNLGYGLLVPGIDNYAHLGGLIGGFLIAVAVYFPRIKNLFQQTAAIMALLISSYVILQYGYNQDVSHADYALSMKSAGTNFENKNYNEAKKFLDYYIDNEINAPEANTLAGIIEVYQNNPSVGKKRFEKAIEQDDNLDIAYYYLGKIYFIENDLVTSNKFIKKAIKLNPSSEEYKNFYDRLNR
jgi:rhomboid protease GluP